MGNIHPSMGDYSPEEIIIPGGDQIHLNGKNITYYDGGWYKLSGDILDKRLETFESEKGNFILIGDKWFKVYGNKVEKEEFKGCMSLCKSESIDGIIRTCNSSHCNGARRQTIIEISHILSNDGPTSNDLIN